MKTRAHVLFLLLAALGASPGAAWAQHPDDIYWTAPWVAANQRIRALYATSDQLYVGGQFTVINGMNLAGLARWNGANWEAVGDQSSAAYLIFPLGTYLYACTLPLGASDGPRFSIWQDNAWQHFAATNVGINNYTAIADVVEFKGDIYVGGAFRNLGGLQTYGIARWDGTAFHDLEGGLSNLTGWLSEYDDGKVYNLVATDSLLYVGGVFTHAGGVKGTNLACWDGARWLPFPDYAITSGGRIAAANGRLYSSGYPSTASDGDGYGMFMWHDGRWWSMNGGLNKFIIDLTTDGENLYVIGPFTRAGDVVANNVARWDGESWSALGSGISGARSWWGGSAHTGVIAARASGEVFLGGVVAGGVSHGVVRFHNPCPYPGHPSPAHASTGVPRWTTLSWDDIGAPGPATSWDVQFGTAKPPPTVASGVLAREWQPDTLEYNRTYYWRVIAHDGGGNHATGQVWSFTTEPLIRARLNITPVVAYCGGNGPDTVTVDVSIERPPGIVDAAGFDLPFDPGVLSFAGCEPGALAAGWDYFGGVDRGGVIRVGGYDPDGIPAGTSGVFARLRFAIDCCALDSIAAPTLCPTNLVDDFKSLTPFCATMTCTDYARDGDVDGDGQVTASDALCAGELFVAPGAPGCASDGWDIRGDVDCSGRVTPRDAACIHRNWSEGNCTFCSGAPSGVRAAAPASSPPAIVVANAVVEDGLLSLVVAVSGVESLEAFGLDVTYPEAHVSLAGMERAPAIEWFEWVAAGPVDGGRARIGGFGSVAASAGAQTDLVVIRMRIHDYLSGVVTLTGFVDDLAGAADVAVNLETLTAVRPVPRALALEQNRPNPFNPLTTIRYEIPAGAGSGRVRLSIYDVAGRRVRALVDRSEGAGTYDVQWDGRDDRGARVTSGVYFYVLDAAGKRLARKLVLLK